jgi:hypothetical protein
VHGIAGSASSLLATAANATCLQTVTKTIADFVTSADIKRIIGTGTVSITVDGGTTWVDVTGNLSTSTWYRAQTTKNTANPRIGFRLASSGDKIAVDYSNVEAGTVATSRILTTTVAVTRPASAITVPVASVIPASGNDFSLVIDWTPATTAAQIIFAADDGGYNNRLYVYCSGSSISFAKAIGGTTSASIKYAVPDVGKSCRLILRMSSTSGISGVFTGQTIVTNSNTTKLNQLTQCGIGHLPINNTAYANGHISVKTVLSQLSDADMLALADRTKTLAEVVG